MTRTRLVVSRGGGARRARISAAFLCGAVVVPGARTDVCADELVEPDSGSVTGGDARPRAGDAASDDGFTKVAPLSGRSEVAEQEETPSLRGALPAAAPSARSLCPEVCGQDEACVHGRCVTSCTPSCREGTFCAPSGACLAIRVAADPLTETEILRRAGADSANSTEALVIDLGGLIFQGVSIGYEWGVIHALSTRLQVMNTGIMNYAVEPQNEFERFEFGVGAAVGYRHYEALWGHLRGFYFGGGGEYQLVQIVDDQSGMFSRTTHIVAPYGEIGYRWVFGSFLFGFGPRVAIRFPFAHGFASRDESSCAGSGDCFAPGAARFEGTLALEVGLFQ